MRLRIIAVGKLKEAHYRAAVDEYMKRLRRYATVEEIELRDEHGDSLTASIRRCTTPRTRVIALTIDGRARSSEDLASWLERQSGDAVDLAFVVGGADGVPLDIVRGAHDTLSLSPMTLPHRLARLVLVEQLYRAMTIRRGEPYHHG